MSQNETNRIFRKRKFSLFITANLKVFSTMPTIVNYVLHRTNIKYVRAIDYTLISVSIRKILD